jgi:uncharacterized surface protein with fasciclin (FAS1) repeats
MRSANIRPARARSAVPLAALATAVALAVAACGGTAAPQAPASGTAAHHPMASPADHMGHMAGARFGPDCTMVPATGTGSFHAMAMDPLVTAASHDPQLSHFVRDIKAAGLAGQLDMTHGITVFAPADSAYSKLPASSRSMMMSSTAELAKFVRYHVARGEVSSAKLASGMAVPTLAGQTLSPARAGVA